MKNIIKILEGLDDVDKLNSRMIFLGASDLDIGSPTSHNFGKSESLNNFVLCDATISNGSTPVKSVLFLPSYTSNIIFTGLKVELAGTERLANITINSNKTSYTGTITGGAWTVYFFGFRKL